MNILDNFDALHQLPDVPVPPMLEAALGYTGPARLVAFYFDIEMDEVRFDDGVTDGGGDTTAWEAFVTHPAVAPGVEAFDLEPLGPATHMLFLDRAEARLYVSRVGALTPLLRMQMMNLSRALPETHWGPIDGGYDTPAEQMVQWLNGVKTNEAK